MVLGFGNQNIVLPEIEEGPFVEKMDQTEGHTNRLERSYGGSFGGQLKVAALGVVWLLCFSMLLLEVLASCSVARTCEARRLF